MSSDRDINFKDQKQTFCCCMWWPVGDYSIDQNAYSVYTARTPRSLVFCEWRRYQRPRLFSPGFIIFAVQRFSYSRSFSRSFYRRQVTQRHGQRYWSCQWRDGTPQWYIFPTKQQQRGRGRPTRTCGPLFLCRNLSFARQNELPCQIETIDWQPTLQTNEEASHSTLHSITQWSHN